VLDAVKAKNEALSTFEELQANITSELEDLIDLADFTIDEDFIESVLSSIIGQVTGQFEALLEPVANRLNQIFQSTKEEIKRALGQAQTFTVALLQKIEDVVGDTAQNAEQVREAILSAKDIIREEL